MFLLVIMFCSLLSCYSCSKPYVPGDPGSPWTEHELFAVRGQLGWIMRQPAHALSRVPGGPVSALKDKVDNWQNISGREIFARYFRTVDEVPPGIKEGGPNLHDALLPNIGKLVRLAFHDCLKDTETGGCNGCLNFNQIGVEGKGVISQGCHFAQTCPKDSLAKVTDNNNLLWVARVLELLYTNAKPPFSTSRRFRLRASLRDTGKSRADLWAFAGLVAMEVASQHHNNYCNPNGQGLCPGQFDERSPPCHYRLPTLTFKTGRRDCVPNCTGADAFYGFCSTANEMHPNPLGNGDSTKTFFKDTFNFTPRESIVILGAHTLGHANEQISGFRHYPWTSGGFEHILNNNYYKQMANPGMYRILKQRSFGWMQECNMRASTFIGDEYGNPITSYWQVRSQWQNNDGGAWNWNPFGLRCDPRKCIKIPESQKVCSNINRMSMFE